MSEMTIGAAVPRPTPQQAAGSVLNASPAPDDVSTDTPTPPEDPGFRGIRKNGKEHSTYNAGHPGAAWANGRSGANAVQARSASGSEAGGGDEIGGRDRALLPGGIRKNGRWAFHRYDVTSQQPSQTRSPFKDSGIRAIQWDGRATGEGLPAAVENRRNPTGIRTHGIGDEIEGSSIRTNQYGGGSEQSLADAIEELSRQTGMRKNGFGANQPV